jgi:hypothetical protein
MGKDQSGTFHPGKGKPSGVNKEEGLGIHPTPPEDMDQYMELTEKYTIGEDELDPSVPIRHPNRNTSKGEDQFKGKENKKESDKTADLNTPEDQQKVVAEELPGVLSKETFVELANYTSNCCISVYVATHKAGVEINERFDPITFKNALQDITKILQNKGTDQLSIEKLLQPGYELLRDDQFWNNLTPGLAVFIAEGYFKFVKLPFAPTSEIVTESSFFVSPLIPLVTNNEYFYLLVISKKQAKLFKADYFGMEFVPVENLPEGVEDVKRLSEKDASTWRTGSRGGTGGANFHGAGGGNPDDKTNIGVYLEAVDDVIYKEIFNKENAPLLLAGVEYLIPIYRSVCDYHNVWEDALTGSYEHMDTTALYQQAREKMSRFFQQRVTKALEAYGNRSATELTSIDPSEVIPATYYGRVARLFVKKGEHIWGRFDEMANELTIDPEQRENSEDLLDHAVVKTITTGGEVFVLDNETMPANGVVAAIMRY